LYYFDACSKNKLKNCSWWANIEPRLQAFVRSQLSFAIVKASLNLIQVITPKNEPQGDKITHTPESQVANTPESQVKLYAGVTGS